MKVRIFKMNGPLAMRLMLPISLMLCASQLAAQAVTVFGSGEQARRCMEAAEFSSNMHITLESDLKDCNFAIRNGSLSPRDLAATYSNRGVIKAALERYQEAFDDYNRAIDLKPEMAEPYIGRGNVFFLADKLDRAIEDYSKAMELDLGRMHIGHLNRGLAYEAQGHLDQAESEYRKAIDLAPDWELPQQKLERVLVKRQRTGKAPTQQNS
jgi:tetratricopeptide (TPR) repeat protein